LSLEEFLTYAKQIAKGMQYLNHMRKIAHRDLKPQNVLINKEGIVKICDLGFSKFLANDGSKQIMST
jgi:serine/threonine protein kinase